MDDGRMAHNAITAVVAFYGAQVTAAAQREQLLLQANEQLAAQVRTLTATVASLQSQREANKPCAAG